MPRVMPAVPQFLRAVAAGRPAQVDRSKNVIYGFVVAQEGPFKSEGRGEFDADSLAEIVRLGNAAPKGLKSRFTHPTLSSDGLGKYLGRAKDFRLADATAADGRKVKAVRADLYLSKSSFDTPGGNLGGYVLDLAEEDSDAMSSSLVLRVKEEYRLDKRGVALKDKDGKELPPLWKPLALHATDIVDTGDAVDGLLSGEDLPDGHARHAAAMLDELFGGQPDDVVRSRCLAWVERYMSLRAEKAGAQSPPNPCARPRLDAIRHRLAELGLNARAARPNVKA